jgi:hypothetical protein
VPITRTGGGRVQDITIAEQALCVYLNEEDLKKLHRTDNWNLIAGKL